MQSGYRDNWDYLRSGIASIAFLSVAIAFMGSFDGVNGETRKLPPPPAIMDKRDCRGVWKEAPKGSERGVREKYRFVN